MVCSLVVIAAAVLGWAVLVYNVLVRDRNRVAQAWSDVDVQLTRRHELVPRLVEIVKGYASYERALLTSLAELRSAPTPGADASPASRHVGSFSSSLSSQFSGAISSASTAPGSSSGGGGGGSSGGGGGGGGGGGW